MGWLGERMTSRARTLHGDERGIAMIMVIGISSIMAIVTTVIVTQSINGLRGAGSERRYEQALHVADAGIDHQLFKLRDSSGSYHTGETVPASFSSVQAEREWVIAAAAAEASGDPTKLVNTNEGQWVALRPSNEAVIYSVGYVPSKSNADKIRVLRAEYDFAPISPAAAILTGGDLSISGNPHVTGTYGSAHTNDDFSSSGNGDFGGYVSATDSWSSSGSLDTGDDDNTGGGMPVQEIPTVDPRSLYDYSEYDLCPNGQVRTGPAYNDGGGFAPSGSSTPCNGTLLADASGSEYRGWKKSGDDGSQGAKWDFASNTVYNGVYYLYQGSAKVSGNPGSSGADWSVTIIAEASGTCPRVGGDIEISGNPQMDYEDTAVPLLMVAGRDLKISGNPHMVGTSMAGEQFLISGNPNVEGNFIAEHSCETAGSMVEGPSSISGNPNIEYDGLEIPIGTSIRTTLWLEL